MKLFSKLRIKKIKRPLLSLFVFCFVLTLSAQFGGGQGTENDPYQIGRPDHLNNIREALNAHFVQTADIDLGVEPWNEEQGWVPIGTFEVPFTGSYNGGNFVINGLTISGFGQYTGLFGSTAGALLRNIALENVDIVGAHYRSATLVGAAVNSAISNCYVTGAIAISGSSQNSGLVGLGSGSQIINCWTDVEITTNGSWSGGLIGTSSGNTISNCFVLGSITSINAAGLNIGGFMGMLNGGTVSNSYTRSTVVTLETANRVGGFVGRNLGGTINDSYSTGSVSNAIASGGFVGGADEGNVNNSYWDTETSERETSFGGEGRATDQMTYPYNLETTYVRWDFEDIWVADVAGTVNDGYPVLFYQELEPPVVLDTPQVIVDVVSIDEAEHIRVRWEPVEDALSYRIYSSESPYDNDWGDPVAVVGENVTLFTRLLSDSDMRFFYVIASSEEPEGRRGAVRRQRRSQALRDTAIMPISSQNVNYITNELGDIIYPD